METNEGCSFWMTALGPDFHWLEGNEPVNTWYADLSVKIVFHSIHCSLLSYWPRGGKCCNWSCMTFEPSSRMTHLTCLPGPSWVTRNHACSVICIFQIIFRPRLCVYIYNWCESQLKVHTSHLLRSWSLWIMIFFNHSIQTIQCSTAHPCCTSQPVNIARATVWVTYHGSVNIFWCAEGKQYVRHFILSAMMSIICSGAICK